MWSSEGIPLFAIQFRDRKDLFRVRMQEAFLSMRPLRRRGEKMTRPTPEQIAELQDVEPANVCCCPDDFKDGMKRGARVAFRAVAKELRKIYLAPNIPEKTWNKIDALIRELDGEKVTR